MNKAKMIRSLFDSLGWDTKTKEITDILQHQGINIMPQQVSNVRAERKIVTVKISPYTIVRTYELRNTIRKNCSGTGGWDGRSPATLPTDNLQSNGR